MEDGRWDLLEWLRPDRSANVINYLNNPADVARAAAVSKSWCKFVISKEFGKRLCMKLCPEISNFTDIELLDRSTLKPPQEASSSTSSEWEILKRAHLVYTYFAHCLLTQNSDKACILRCIGASSTDNFPEESIENTLEPSDTVEDRPSYWSSGGQRDPNVQESLVYRLGSDLHTISEIRIQPFKAFFQFGYPIYSVKRVRFRMGHSKLDLSELDPITGEEESLLTRDENYVWTYTSPEYPMSQESSLQAFKLPRPILCIGGILKIEMLDRVQKQAMDGLYYICVCHVQVIGCQVSPLLNVATSADRTILRYHPQASTRSATAESSERFSSNDDARSCWQTLTDRFRQLGPITVDDGDYDLGMLDVPEEEPTHICGSTVISNEFGKRLCMKLCPEISNFTDIELVDRSTLKPLQKASSSTSSEWEILKRAHLVYTYFAHCLLTQNSDKACILRCIGASSTDNFPEESIDNTLEPSDTVGNRPSYWSSGGQRDPNVQESLVYRLGSDLYTISEIKIQPFKAFFQSGCPIYSAKRVRFRMGHSKLDLSELDLITGEEESLLTRDENYVWTYTSPEYPMSQESSLQAFKLPRPILCIGGILKIELLDRVQKQAMDGLYYICVRHVQVIGCQVSPLLDVVTSADRTVLRYRPQAGTISTTDESSEGFSSNEDARSH